MGIYNGGTYDQEVAASHADAAAGSGLDAAVPQGGRLLPAGLSGVETPLFGGGGATYVHPDPFTIGTLTATNLTVTGITGAGADRTVETWACRSRWLARLDSFWA